MILLYINLFVVAIVLSYVNVYFAKLADPTIMDIVKSAVYMLPFQFLVGLGYAIYYSQGIKHLSYLSLNLSAYPILLGSGIVVHFLFFKDHTFSTLEILGIIFTAIGMIFFTLSKIQGA